MWSRPSETRRSTSTPCGPSTRRSPCSPAARQASSVPGWSRRSLSRGQRQRRGPAGPDPQRRTVEGGARPLRPSRRPVAALAVLASMAGLCVVRAASATAACTTARHRVERITPVRGRGARILPTQSGYARGHGPAARGRLLSCPAAYRPAGRDRTGSRGPGTFHPARDLSPDARRRSSRSSLPLARDGHGRAGSARCH